MVYPKNKKLTKAEQKWVEEMQGVLDRCPSERLGFYTIGDPVIHLYDRSHQKEIEAVQDDLPRIVARHGWGFDETLDFPAPVDGVCG